MGKVFTLILFAILFQAGGYAQTAGTKSRLGYGLIGGLDVYGTFKDGFRMKKVGGGFIGIDLSYAVGQGKFQPTVHFQPNWEQFSFRTEEEIVGNKFLFQSINLPVLLRYKFANAKRLRPFLEVGASYKWKMKYYYRYRDRACGIVAGMPCIEFDYVRELTDPSMKGEVVMLIGAGVELDLNRMKVPVAIRLNDGLGTFTMNYHRRGVITGLKTQTIQVVTGVTF